METCVEGSPADIDVQLPDCRHQSPGDRLGARDVEQPARPRSCRAEHIRIGCGRVAGFAEPSIRGPIGSREYLRRALQQAAARHQLDGLTGSWTTP